MAPSSSLFQKVCSFQKLRVTCRQFSHGEFISVVNIFIHSSCTFYLNMTQFCYNGCKNNNVTFPAPTFHLFWGGTRCKPFILTPQKYSYYNVGANSLMLFNGKFNCAYRGKIQHFESYNHCFLSYSDIKRSISFLCLYAKYEASS